jgi:hypothetical protein
MSTINRLSSVDVLQPGDQIPVWDSSNGDTRKASMTTLLAFVESYFADPDYSTRIVAPAVDYFTVDIGATGDSIWMIVNPTLNFTNGAITLPPASSAVNDQEITVVFTAAVSTFVITSAGATVLGAPVQIGGYDSFRVRYNSAQLTWYTLDTTGDGTGSGVSQIVRQDFTGDGTTTTFTLTTAPSGLGNELQIFIDGVYQERAGYTVTGSNVVFSEAPPSLSTIEVLGWSVTLGAETSANLVSYTPAGTGAVLTTVQAKLRESVSVLDFGADPTNTVDSYPQFVLAIAAAVAAQQPLYVPSGTYRLDTGIVLTGTITITGPEGDSASFQPARLNMLGAGNCFSAVSAEFGAISIRNLSFTGGDGSYCIRSSRPQSHFENLLMETWVGGGVELFEAGTGSQASWGTTLRNIKWVAPASATLYRGFQIRTNGGHVSIDHCTAIRGAVGLNVDQTEALDISNCSFNQQQNVFSADTDTNTASIRLSGSGYKKAICIRNCYIEAFTHGIYVESCESLSIKDNYIADAGSASNFGSIWLKDDPVPDYRVNNVSIKSNMFADSGNDMSSIYIGNNASNVEVINNYISCIGGPGPSTALTKGTGTNSYVDLNKLVLNPSIGIGYADPNGLLVKPYTAPRAVTTMSVGDAVAATSGNGLTFPATVAPSSDLYTLDDYREVDGVFTAVASTLVNCSDVVFTAANYTKIGRVVILEMSGTLTITAPTTVTSFYITIPLSTQALSSKAAGIAWLNFDGIGVVLDGTGESSTSMWVNIPANQVLAASTGQYIGLSITYTSGA